MLLAGCAQNQVTRLHASPEVIVYDKEDKQRFNKEMEEYSANRVPEPEEAHVDTRAYNQHVTAYADPHAQYYEQHAQYMDQQQYAAGGQQQHYDPNVHGADPYAQHAAYYQQQYHYA